MRAVVGWAAAIGAIACLCLAVSFLAFFLLFGSFGEAKEELLYRQIASGQKFLVSNLFQSDRQCVLPGGYGPRGYLFQKFPQMKTSVERVYDSQSDWFVILFRDAKNEAFIIPLRYDQVNLKNDAVICSATLLVQVGSDKEVQFTEN